MTIGIMIRVHCPEMTRLRREIGLARRLHNLDGSHATAAAQADLQTILRIYAMNVVNSENHATIFINKFVARIIQTATCDLHTRCKPSAHDLAMAFQAAFAARKAAL